MSKRKSRSFSSKVRNVALLLEILSKSDERYTQLQIKCQSQGMTLGPFQSTRKYCLDEKYINRPERGLYAITKAGRKFLDAAK